MSQIQVWSKLLLFLLLLNSLTGAASDDRLLNLINERSYETIGTKGIDPSIKWNPHISINAQQVEEMWSLRGSLLTIARSQLSFIQENLRSLDETGTADPSFEQVLFDFRTMLKWVRSMTFVCSRNHSPPAALQMLAKDLGKLRDDLKFNQGQKAQQLSTSILPMLSDKQFEKTLLRIEKLGLDSNLENWIQQSTNYIKKTLKQDTLTLHQFHKVRKHLEYFLALQESLIVLKHPDLDRNVYNTTYRLHKFMGKKHNKFVKKSCQSNFNYNKARIKWPKKLRTRLESFFQ